MSNSLFISICRLPLSFEELRQAIYQAFDKFALARPVVELHQTTNLAKSLLNSIITIHGKGTKEHCWISFGEYPIEITGEAATTYMGDVTTRGSWLFAAVVLFALFEFDGITIFNDSGELDGQAEYDMTGFQQVISNALSSGEQYLAR